MFRARRAPSPVDITWPLLAAALALAVVLSGLVSPPPVAAAGGPTGHAASVRGAQATAEASMRRADKQIKRLQQQRRHHAKRLAAAKLRLDRAIARRDRVRTVADRATTRAADARQTLQRELRVRPAPSGKQVVDKPALRKRVRKLERRAARLERQVEQLRRAVDRTRDVKQSRLKKIGVERIRARKAARERAEDKLSARIAQMKGVASERLAGSPRLATRKGFMKPTRGTITQPYGCTGFRLNPSRGACRHFHDGVDIAARRGTKVRASADGVVAYVGFSPWDAGKRAYVVIIVHARGYESLYAHLQPKRLVKAGQRVRRGDVIGRVGSTGRTTGPHVHWEVARGFPHTVNPVRAAR